MNMRQGVSNTGSSIKKNVFLGAVKEGTGDSSAVDSHRPEEIQHIPSRSEQLLGAVSRYLGTIIESKPTRARKQIAASSAQQRGLSVDYKHCK